MSKIVNLVNYGKVQCSKVTRANHPDAKNVFNFIEIPFAQPPVGKLRFMPPKKVLPWNGVLCNAEQTKIPVQPMTGVDYFFKFSPRKRSFYEFHCSEDCLYLNVFVPEVSSAEKLPVMVWFYGGAFQIGPNDYFDGTSLAGLNNVIVVVPNYRVNTFGFLSLGKDTPCKGNLGLLDQLQALKFVRENIESFGGDKDNVTIFGQSAGGISVNMHMISPLSQGYFNKAISFSGTAAMSRIFISDQSRATKKFLEILGIDDTETEKIIEKLQNLSTSEINEAQEKLVFARYLWFPTLDEQFFPDSPLNLLSQGRFAKVPYILGCNNSEGGWVMNVSVPGYLNGISENDYFLYSRSLLKWFDKSIDAKKALPHLLKTYNDRSPSEDKMYYSKGIAGVMADANFLVGIVQELKIHADSGSPTYFYHMTMRARYSHEKEYGPRAGRKPSYVDADHGDDVYLAWGSPFVEESINDGFRYSEDEKKLSLSLMTYISNFAKTGNPNQGKDVDFYWPAYTKQNRQHLVFDSPFSLGSNFGEDKLHLYTKILPKL